MAFKDILTSPDPEPANLLQAFRDEVSQGSDLIDKRVKTLEEQKEVANRRLDFFLSNIANSPGAAKIVREFYKEKHGQKIDTTDPEVLANEISSIEDIVNKGALPALSKEDLRNEFGVEGAYTAGVGTDHLTPQWVIHHEDEPYRTTETSGTTGRPWSRAVTRNDWVLMFIQFTSSLYQAMVKNNIRPKNTGSIIIIPGEEIIEIISKSFSFLGSEVEAADIPRLKSGGKDEIREGERLIQHLESYNKTVVMSAASEIMKGKFGVEIRRGNVDIDVFVNAGRKISDNHRQILQKNDVAVEDYFGETEYPQSGGLKTEVNGTEGFNLPFDSQINLVYDTDTEELSYEGEGRFAYLPFALEGQAVPGVYVSGINCTIEKIGGEYQLLTNVERVVDPNRGCYRG